MSSPPGVDNVELDVAMERLLDDLKQRQDRRDANHAVRSADAAQNATYKELQEELNVARNMLSLAQSELMKERERHAQTKELLRLALKPQEVQAADGDIAARSAAATPFSSAHKRASPTRRQPSPPQQYGTSQHIQSTPLREMLSKAVSSTPTPSQQRTKPLPTTPRNRTPIRASGATSTNRTKSPSASSRKASGTAFGSRMPRFVDISLSGDHALIHTKHKDWCEDDDAIWRETKEPHTTPAAKVSQKRTQRPPSAKKVELTEMHRSATSPYRPGLSPGPSLVADTLDLHTLRSPDIAVWQQQVSGSPQNIPH